MDKEKELELLKKWKSDLIKSLCKYDCSSVEELRHNAYNKGRADYENECKKRYCVYADKDCIIGNIIGEDYYQQGYADALNIDMDKPMHFTDEQKAWVKNYIILNAERQRADGIDAFFKALNRDNLIRNENDLIIASMLAEQLKEQNNCDIYSNLG